MIDTHCHLRNTEDIKIKGLEFAVLSASNLEDSKENVKLQMSNDKLKASVGVHPQELITNYELLITNLEELLSQNKEIVAVGECGLDFSAENYDRHSQEIMFRAQICLALKYDKPLIIHSRKAMDETLEVLKSYKNLRGAIHCYSGGIKRIKKVLELPGEWFFGIDGNLTYEAGLQEVVKNIPKDRLVLETDSPELTPIPHRGEKNYPEYVKFIYQKVAEIWVMSLKETEELIDGNAKRIFDI
ncbi:TatD family hydrolase [Candidatus Shapirobacteria bacterium]|nr:TatD family hydrolase [Candidatus Shapirobacteria bacterium]